MALRALLSASTNVVELSELKNLQTGVYVEDATGTATIFQADGTTQVAQVAVAHVAGTSGRATLYRGAFPANTPIVAGTRYIVRVVMQDTSGNTRTFAGEALARDG